MSYIKGYGISLKDEHFEEILNQKPKNINFCEIMVDNFLVDDSSSLNYLNNIKDLYPISFHGIGMSLGSYSGLDYEYLTKVKNLIHKIEPKQYSEHLCFTNADKLHSNDLLPMPYTNEAIDVFSRNIKKATEFLEFPIMIENLSNYVEYEESKMTEWDFLSKITEESNSNILLDLNNIYVNSFNHHFNPITYVESINPTRVKEIHLAGFEKVDDYLLDSHGGPVHDNVWHLFQRSRILFPEASVVIEWDNNIPSLQTMLNEVDKVIKLDNELL